MVVPRRVETKSRKKLMFGPFFSCENQEGDQGSGDDESHLDAEGLLERERRWMEAIFAASRPDDLR